MGAVTEEVGVNLEGVEVVVVVRSGRERSEDDRSATNVTWTEVAKLGSPSGTQRQTKFSGNEVADTAHEVVCPSFSRHCSKCAVSSHR